LCLAPHQDGGQPDVLLALLVHYWPGLSTTVLAAHVLANVVWIGALLAVAILTGRGRFSADPVDVGTLARLVFLTLASPAFFVSFAAGATLIALQPLVYARLPWMHAKLMFAFLVIALHYVIGGRARRVAKGKAQAARGIAAIATATFLCAAGAVLFGVAKSLP
jgi:protoporphyrinogen IX oxidase